MLEYFRRMLKMEAAVAKTAAYLQHASTETHRLTKQQIENVRCITGCGLNGAGSEFWETPANPTPKIKELKDLRANVAPLFTVATELDWGFYLIAAMHDMQDKLANITDAAVAKEVLNAIKTRIKQRILVYLENLKPILIYGAKLTAFQASLFTLAQSLRGIIKHPFPADCKLAAIDSKGHILDATNRPLPFGHLGLKQWPLLPFDDNCLAVKPLAPDAIKAMTESFLAQETTLITKLIAAAGYDSDAEPTAITLMRKGRAEILTRMHNDDHTKNLTSVLWPSASLKDAHYDPRTIFGTP
jgi:hypothetical protein